jgi:capsular polysaccharide transport system permease protein
LLQILNKRSRELVGRSNRYPTNHRDQTSIIDVPDPRRVPLGLFGWSFIFCVFIPTLLSSAYLAIVASDEYVSEAKFTVRTASETPSSILSDTVTNIAASMGLGMSSRTSTQDVFIVSDYILSRTIINDLGGTPLLNKLYSKPEIDWLSRLSAKASIEDSWKYWKKKISAFIDTPSSIVTLEVRGYSREDAHRLAQRILERSEQLVNQISARSREDAVNRAKSELARAEQRLGQAQLALLAFRNQERLIDPSLSAQSLSELITKLTQERLTLENNRAVLRSSVDQNAPTLRVLSAQIAAIDSQIDGLKKQLTNKIPGSSLSSQITGYENLQIEAQFAEKAYSVAQASYDRARMEQEKQQLYLVTIDKPSMPQEATYPKVLLDSLTILAALFILWSMVSLLLATVKDHMGG